MSLGDAIRTRREQRGWTQQDLATRAGISEATVQNVEAGRTERPTSLPHIAEALGTDVATLRAGRAVEELRSAVHDAEVEVIERMRRIIADYDASRPPR